jgi:hypothetical protein
MRTNAAPSFAVIRFRHAELRVAGTVIWASFQRRANHAPIEVER